jgi:hypothetical protein
MLKRDKLTPPERQVRDAITTGLVVDLRARDPQHDNPATGATWGPERSIRGPLLGELLAEGRDPAAPPAWLLHLQGARITGALDLEAVTVRCPVTLRDCYFDEEVILKEARVTTLRLPGCHLPGLAGQQVETRGNLGLNQGFTAKGNVNLQGAHIGGRLELDHAWLCNPGGTALAADGLTVGQTDLFLSSR